MLLKGSNFWIHSLNGCARNRCKTNLASVTLQGAKDEGIGHAIDISSGFGVGEGLVGGGLLKAVWTC
jgi:hypothetical protein